MNKTEIIDNIEKAIDGDQSAITILYNYTYSNMYLLAYNLCRNENTAEDILQESYITAFKNLKKLRRKDSFEFWLKGIVINEWHRCVRNDKNAALMSLDDVEYDIKSDDNYIQDIAERNEVKDMLWQYINQLPENQRICIILFYYQGMSIEEIALTLNIPNGSVKSRLYYAKAKLRKCLGNKDISLNSIAAASATGGPWQGSEAMLARIMAALNTTAGGTTAVAAETVAGGLLLRIMIGCAAAITAVGLSGAILNGIPEREDTEPDLKTFSTTVASTTTTTTVAATTTTTAATTVTTTASATRAETVTFDYQVVSGGIQLTKYTGSSGNVVIPKAIDGHAVVSIGDGAFQKCRNLQRVEIPGSVKTIGSNAFKECVNLMSVSLGSVNKIGDAAFLGCRSLKKVRIPDSVKSVGIYAFSYCSLLAEVTLAEGTELINYCAFYKCPKLSKVTLPASLNQIGRDAFAEADPSLTLFVYDGSYSQEYAAANGINTQLIG